jgi:hypothetical protein
MFTTPQRSRTLQTRGFSPLRLPVIQLYETMSKVLPDVDRCQPRPAGRHLTTRLNAAKVLRRSDS